MHYHATSVRDSNGSVRPDGRQACDGVYWSGSAWRVCLSEYIPHRVEPNGYRVRALQPIELQYHGGEEDSRRALAEWLTKLLGE